MLFYNYDLEKIVRANHPLRDVARVTESSEMGGIRGLNTTEKRKNRKISGKFYFCGVLKQAHNWTVIVQSVRNSLY